jgi:hypothetical protein
MVDLVAALPMVVVPVEVEQLIRDITVLLIPTALRILVQALVVVQEQ